MNAEGKRLEAGGDGGSKGAAADAALAATLEIYGKGNHFQEIPVLRMLSQTKKEVEARAIKADFDIRGTNFASPTAL